ncbi:MAG TPA: hypothetical protein VNK04_24790 [Gemmataceae bacterium]|nr:hypothetical protein [Gemmataceae bacterium]
MLTRCAGRQTLFTLLTALTLAGMVGCGSSKYPVEGKVVWSDGTPARELAGGMVVFESTETPRSARGEIKEDGSFRMVTERPNDGVAPGSYRVLVIQPEPDDSIRPRPPLAMDTRYSAFETSGLTYTVQPGKNEPVFKVERFRRKGR